MFRDVVLMLLLMLLHKNAFYGTSQLHMGAGKVMMLMKHTFPRIDGVVRKVGAGRALFFYHVGRIFPPCILLVSRFFILFIL